MSCCSGKLSNVLIPDWVSSVKFVKVKNNKKLKATINDLIELKKELQRIKHKNSKLKNKYSNEKLKRMMVQKNIDKFGSNDIPTHEAKPSNSMSLASNNTNTTNSTAISSEVNALEIKYANPLM